jgi:hypothetical protein
VLLSGRSSQGCWWTCPASWTGWPGWSTSAYPVMAWRWVTDTITRI